MDRSPRRGRPATGRRQDETEFREFAAGFTSRLFRAAYLLVGDRDAAEDAVQTVLLRTLRRWDTARAAPEAYSRRVLVNVCRDQWRDLRRHPRWTLDNSRAAVEVGASPLESVAQRLALQQGLTAIPLKARDFGAALLSDCPSSRSSRPDILREPSSQPRREVLQRCALCVPNNLLRCPMPDHVQLEEALTHQMRALTDGLSPRSGLAERVITKHRGARRRARLAGATVAAVAVAAVVVAAGALLGSHASPSPGSRGPSVPRPRLPPGPTRYIPLSSFDGFAPGWHICHRWRGSGTREDQHDR